ncbi:elongation factor 1-gamma-like [Liolophura sinensis]|uniref:elongation factor 1-gamma-like n=1 Tax=Liolophura sinensis TaxID=3198878 RepID=UPI0031593AEB
MADGTLYTYPNNFRAYKALIASKYSGANVKVATDFKFGETNKTKDFLAKFPLGKVPAFLSSSGEAIFESNAIAYYVSNQQLIGSSQWEKTTVLQWLNFADNEILPAVCTWVFPCLGVIQFNKNDTEKAKKQLQLALSVLNEYLGTRTFLVGERITLADIACVCNLLLAYQHVFDPQFRKPYVNVNRWFVTLINQPNFKAVIGNFQLCTKAAQFDANKYAELHGQQKKEGKKDGGKKDKAKSTPKKKEKKPEPEDEEDDIPLAKEPKDPFADLPKGTFNMDEFKREYSNKDIAKEAIPYLWKNFDAEHYSWWKCDYKYNDELKMIFMSCNLVGGMFQRIEKLRKNAFATMLIFGEDNNTTISGVWMFKGQKLGFELSEDWQVDYAYYDWRKLDPSNPDDRQLINDYLLWEGKFDGNPLEVNQGKTFK